VRRVSHLLVCVDGCDGIIVAEVVPLATYSAHFSCDSSRNLHPDRAPAGRNWPATYLIVAAGFFPAAQSSRQRTPAGQQLASKLGERPRVVTAVGCVITEPKIAPSGFATFLLKLKSIEFEGKTESTSAGLAGSLERRAGVWR
jgi:hypothetical protein